MTELEIMEKIEKARVEQGLTMHDMDDLTWHSYGCYSQTLQRLRKLRGLAALHNLRKYAEVVGYEITLKKIKEKGEENDV